MIDLVELIYSVRLGGLRSEYHVEQLRYIMLGVVVFTFFLYNNNQIMT
jgi:hypothetical protein